MTKLGEYLARKMLNRSELARKTGITRNRMQNLAERETTKITGHEVHLLALALDMEPNELHEILFGDLKLPSVAK